MVGFKEDQIHKFHDELVSQTVAGLREKHTACVTAFLVELLRHPMFNSLNPENIQLVITNNFEGSMVKTSYHVKVLRGGR